MYRYTIVTVTSYFQASLPFSGPSPDTTSLQPHYQPISISHMHSPKYPSSLRLAKSIFHI